MTLFLINNVYWIFLYPLVSDARILGNILLDFYPSDFCSAGITHRIVELWLGLVLYLYG